MKLRKIEIFGFKSFARRTEFEFGNGITAVVGPNGCGKSNLVDALRWVLGEQRPKLLRSSSMPDVVYRGASARVDAAEVTLTFDNEDGRLDLEAPEVQITRRLSRDGISEYGINGRSARLRDIRELLLDTGLGVGGYSFMEQGRIDYILNASAMERRLLVEEAAGTSRYRLRRKEALRKLDRTEQDLARATDMISELERQVRSLKVQAGRARNYVEKRDRLTRVAQVVYTRRLESLQDELGTLLAERELAAQQESECRTELGTAEGSLTERETEERAFSGEVAEARTEMVERRARAEHLRTRRSDLERRVTQSAEEKVEATDRKTAVTEQIELLAREREEAKSRLDELTEQDETTRAKRDAVRERLDDASEVQREFDARNDALQSQVVAIVEEAQAARDRVSDLESEQRALEGSRSKLLERIAEVGRLLVALRTKAREERATCRTHTERRTSLERELSANDESLSSLYPERQRRTELLEKESAAMAANRSRLDVLEDMIQRHEGASDQVRALLERKAQGETALQCVRGLVADMITPSVETAVAVEAALGPWAEALVVGDRDEAIQLLRQLRREGTERVRILSLSELLQAQNGSRRKSHLLARAEIPDESSKRLLTALLAHFDLLPSDVPLDLCSPRAGRALVASDGEMMLAPYDTMSRGSADQMGLITRRSERDRLTTAVMQSETTVATLRGELDETVRQIAERERDRELKARAREEVTRLEREALQEFRGSMERMKLLREELGHERSESGELETRAGLLAKDRATVTELREQKEEQREALQAQRQELRQTLETALEQRQAIEEELSVLQLELTRITERREAARERSLTFEARERERGEELRHLERRLGELQQQETSIREELAGDEQEIQRLDEEQAVSERLLKERVAILQEHQEASRQVREQVQTLRRDLETSGSRRQELELREQKQRIHVQSLEQRMQEDLALDPVRVREELERGCFARPEPPAPVQDVGDDEAPTIAAAGEDSVEQDADAEAPTPRAIAAEPPPPDDADREAIDELCAIDLDELTTEMEQLKGSLQRLGPVNLDAIADLQEVEGRATFFQQQREDLLEARRRLRAMIEEIDKECDVRFEKTFAAVREQFRILFRKLFHGGRADLLLLDADETGEAGVDIVAAPPGKDPRSIAMLSGGERTMTAVALLFSLFSTRPSPFCVLDEVDAALDESNIERFTSMVKNFLGGTQFVIVTHSKRTMAAADTIYGVTMQGDGVSRPLAMRFEDLEPDDGPSGKRYAASEEGPREDRPQDDREEGRARGQSA